MAEDNSEVELTEIPASEILDKIQKGEPVDYNSVAIEGDLDLSKLELPMQQIEQPGAQRKQGLLEIAKLVSSRIEITNTDINGKLIFSNIILQQPINFKGSQFKSDVYFRETKFNGEADFGKDTFSGNANFRRATFSGDANFYEAIFSGDAYFAEAKFSRDANFRRDTFCRNADFSAGTFSENTSFRRAKFHKDASFKRTVFEGDFLTFRYTEFNNPESQEYACRRAKNVLERIGDRDEAGYHFYREMEGKRKQKNWYLRYPEFVFIQLIFGYGVHPFRLMACWFGFVFLFAAIYSLGHGIDAAASQLNGNATLADYVWFSIATAVTPGYAGYKPVTDFKWVAGIEAIFGTFMWAAFIATFARKYMR
jgi:hypothetical protein